MGESTKQGEPTTPSVVAPDHGASTPQEPTSPLSSCNEPVSLSPATAPLEDRGASSYPTVKWAGESLEVIH